MLFYTNHHTVNTGEHGSVHVLALKFFFCCIQHAQKMPKTTFEISSSIFNVTGQKILNVKKKKRNETKTSKKLLFQRQL